MRAEDDSVELRQLPRARLRRPNWILRQPAYVHVLAGFLVVTLLGAVALLWYRSLPVEAIPTQFPNEDWILSCHLTKGAAEWADESFSGPALEGFNRNRGDGYVERVYPGTRVQIAVDVRHGGAHLRPGRYTLYGTISHLDMGDRRATLIHCVFIPR